MRSLQLHAHNEQKLIAESKTVPFNAIGYQISMFASVALLILPQKKSKAMTAILKKLLCRRKFCNLQTLLKHIAFLTFCLQKM